MTTSPIMSFSTLTIRPYFTKKKINKPIFTNLNSNEIQNTKMPSFFLFKKYYHQTFYTNYLTVNT